jgi:acyl-ACP thioesterase
MYVSAFDLKYLVIKQLIAVDRLRTAGLEKSHVLWILHQFYGEVNKMPTHVCGIEICPATYFI